MKIQWGFNVQILYYNNKSTLDNKYKKIITWYGILKKSIIFYILEQNRGFECAGALFTEKAHLIRNAANLPINYWPEYYKAVNYLFNHIPTKWLN